MSEQSSTSDRLKSAVIPYTGFRIALATAFLGSVGASLAWLSILAYESHDWELALTAATGAALGFVVHWLQHYVRAALHEHRGDDAKSHAHHPLMALAWASATAFIALASEHLLTEVVSAFLRPFLASLASLIPAGAIIGWSMSRGRRKDKNLIEFVFDGLLIGVSIALVTGLVWTIAFGSAPWAALMSWWGLIGIGMHAMTGTERNAVNAFDPIIAVAVVFAGTFLLNLLPDQASSYDKLGAFKTLPIVVRAMAAEVQNSPDVPATFWVEAEQLVAASEAEREQHGAAVPRETAHEAPPVRPAVPSGTISAEQLRRAVDNLTAPPAPDSSKIARDQRDRVKSWFIIVLFAIGAGLAPIVERELRPLDYPNSQTFRRDVTLAACLLIVVVVASVVGRFGPAHA